MADLWGDGWTRWGRSRCRAAEEQAQVEVVLVTAQDPQEFQTHADQGRHGHTFSRHLKGKMEEKGQAKHLFLFVNEPSEGKSNQWLKFQEISFFFSFYLVAIIFHQLKNKSSVHKGQQVVEEERQADIDFLSLFHFLKEQWKEPINQQLHWMDVHLIVSVLTWQTDHH